MGRRRGGEGGGDGRGGERKGEEKSKAGPRAKGGRTRGLRTGCWDGGRWAETELPGGARSQACFTEEATWGG